jgi:hypothetical protein
MYVYEQPKGMGKAIVMWFVSLPSDGVASLRLLYLCGRGGEPETSRVQTCSHSVTVPNL